MNAKKAKFLRRSAAQQSQGQALVVLQPMKPVFIPAPPLSKGPGATFLGQRVLAPNCVRHQYKLHKGIYKAYRQAGLNAKRAAH